jgi:hypothetical protein
MHLCLLLLLQGHPAAAIQQRTPRCHIRHQRPHGSLLSRRQPRRFPRTAPWMRHGQLCRWGCGRCHELLHRVTAWHPRPRSWALLSRACHAPQGCCWLVLVLLMSKQLVSSASDRPSIWVRRVMGFAGLSPAVATDGLTLRPATKAPSCPPLNPSTCLLLGQPPGAGPALDSAALGPEHGAASSVGRGAEAQQAQARRSPQPGRHAQ